MRIPKTLNNVCWIALASVAAACTQSPVVGLGSAIIPLGGPCPQTPQQGVEFTDEVDQLRIVITGDGIDEPLEAEGGLAQLTLENIPAGEGRSVIVYGQTASGTPLWRGMGQNVSVVRGETTAIDVLLSRIADLSCPRTPQTARRAFHTATRLTDGRVLIVGGAEQDVDASAVQAGASRLLATGAAEIYDPTTGGFTPIGELAVPRMFHTATLMGDGRVAIVGGMGEALVLPVDNASPFPVQPGEAISLIEVFDPEANAFVATFDDVVSARVFHAAALNVSGDLVITGGVAAPAAINDLGNALRTTTLCDSALTTCIGGPEMKARRVGHGLFLLDSGDLIAWGGSIEGNPIDGVSGFKPERMGVDGAAFQMLDLGGFTSNELNVFFAAFSQYSPFRVLSAGGLIRDAGGTFRLAAINVAGTSRGPVYIFDAGDEAIANWVLSAGPYDDNGQLLPLAIDSPRFFGAAAPLPGGRRALVTGGFSSLAFAPSSGIEIYNESPFQVTPVAVGGEVRALRSARGGLTATAIGDGSVLLSGGETVDGARRAPLPTGEIFMDPLDPVSP